MASNADIKSAVTSTPEAKPVDTVPVAAPVAVKPVSVPKPATAAKPVAKKVAAPKASVKKAAPVKTKQPASKAVVKTPRTAPKAAPVKKVSKMQDTVEKMTAETKKVAEETTAKLKTLAGEATERAKVVYAKGTELASEATEFTKGNLEAVVESGKILAAGMQDMGKTVVADVRSDFEEATAAVKSMTAIKSPTEFFQFQSELLRKSFDTMMARGSKNSEAVVKLANDAFQPISNRVSVAMDKVKKAA